MTEEMKLLYALCDALGFEVNVDIDRCERGEPAHRLQSFQRIRGVSNPRSLNVDGSGAYERDSDGNYRSRLKVPETSYRLERKPTPGFLLRDQAE